MSGGATDRRAFLGTASAVLALGTLPMPLRAMPSLVPTSQTAPLGRWGAWHIDDMWNHLPRATERIGLGRRAGRCSVDVAAIDRQFCG